MPQKKNPDLLEYLRGKTGNTYGNLFSMLTILKGLPLSYFKDLQDDKEIVFKTNDTLIDSIKILDEILNALAMASPFSLEEKQVLLEAENLNVRKKKIAEILSTYTYDDYDNTTIQ